MIFDFILRYGLQIFLWVVFALAVFFYMTKSRRYPEKTEKFFSVLIAAAITGRLLDAAIKTIAQYYLWSGDALTQPFLNAGLNSEIPVFLNKLTLFQSSGGYFLFYILMRFWLSVFVSIAVALLFGALLGILKKRRERFFDVGEIKLGMLAAFLVGWPNFTIFLPIVFGSIVIISVIRLIVFKIKYTTLGFPFILACGATFILSGVIGPLINLNVLKI